MNKDNSGEKGGEGKEEGDALGDIKRSCQGEYVG